ncbi:helix-turn-helix domain-containing protein [Escherichia coli]|nr:helix-turn-helix domain-containing protein [Escherichia coli]EIH7858010.1 helix-turn-helix domain-containing protein [Escherichia coli]EIZ5896929.1 helix-turn-helix domain-containing protein [Escherichia coli]
MSEIKLLTVNQVARLFGVSRWTIFKWMKSLPGFPQSVNPPNHRVLFLEETILEYLRSKGRKYE